MNPRPALRLVVVSCQKNKPSASTPEIHSIIGQTIPIGPLVEDTVNTENWLARPNAARSRSRAPVHSASIAA